MNITQVLSGWKTYCAAAVLILTGLATIETGIAGGIQHYSDPSSPTALDTDQMLATFTKGALAIGSGLGLIGIGHKLDKNTTAIKDNTVAVQDVAPVNPNAVKSVETILAQFHQQLLDAGDDPKKLSALAAKMTAPTPPKT